MNLLEEKLYEIVAAEIDRGDIFSGLYTKAFSDVGGDKQLALATYIKMRVKQLMAEYVDYAREKEAQDEITKSIIENQQKIEQERNTNFLRTENSVYSKEEVDKSPALQYLMSQQVKQLQQDIQKDKRHAFVSVNGVNYTRSEVENNPDLRWRFKYLLK